MADRRRVAERIAKVAHGQAGTRELRAELLSELGRALSFDAYAWLLTDPETEVGSDPLADVPCLPELPRLIRLKYLTETNRWTGLVTPVVTLQAATEGRPERSTLWREMLSSYDVTDVASAVFRDRFGCWGFVDLWRIGQQQPFGDEDVALLRQVSSGITDGLREAQARTFSMACRQALPDGPIVLVLSPDLSVRAQTAETEAFLRALVPPRGDARPVPAGAYNVGAQLLAVEAGVDDHPPRARVHLANGAWLSLRAARMEGSERAHGDIAVTIEGAGASDRIDLFSRAFRLTRRESELLGGLARGADTRRLADELFVSEHTIQDHLKSIFAKTGAHNRRTLLARALGA